MLPALIFRILKKSVSVWHRIKTRLWYSIFFGHVGVGSQLRNPVFLVNPHKIRLGNWLFALDGARMEALRGGTISIGNNCAIGQNFTVTSSGGELYIGNDVTISFDVMITNIDHEYQAVGVHILQQPHLITPTTIGDNCFIGSGVKIMAGTFLGRQCIVSANAVVRGTFPDYCVIVGAPARIVKRYNPDSEKWEKTRPDGSFA